MFARQLFVNEGYQWAGTILAFLAVVMVPIPYILSHYGFRLRQRSPWARHVIEEEDEMAKRSDGESLEGDGKERA